MKRIYIIIATLIVAASLGIFLLNRKSHAPAHNTTTRAHHTAAAQTDTQTPPTFDKQQYSLTDPTSPWVIVNKQRPLSPKTYSPSDLVVPSIPLRSNITSTEQYVRKQTATALEAMVAAAKQAGITLNLQSGYRSYNFQVTLYNRYVQQQGQAVADTQSARPGYSEHQTGFAADLGGTSQPSCNVEACFGDTPEGKWLAAHASEYGFIIRYPADRDSTTGYVYEPWHVRYVGTELAAEMRAKGVATLEDFFGTGNAASY